MRIAFYAPLKAIDHPVPSGDRRVARGFVDLLRALGHEVVLPSRLRTFDRQGELGRQHRLAVIGSRQGQRLLKRWRACAAEAPQLWFTYHGYHKAPDHLGPVVASGLAIPYVMAEASVSPRQAGGPWGMGHASTLAALRRADVVLAMTERDRLGLEPHVAGDRLLLFPPFLDATPFRQPRTEHGAIPVLLAVGMMREDVKRQSFEMLLDALALVRDCRWQLVIVGDGPARAAIEQRSACLVPGRVRFTGALTAEEMPTIYAAADIYVWPGFGEAYGMAILEAMAAGLPVVAGRHGGIPEIVQDGRTGLLATSTDEFAMATRTLLLDPERRRRLGRQAAATVTMRHDRTTAAARLQAALERACLGEGAAA